MLKKAILSSLIGISLTIIIIAILPVPDDIRYKSLTGAATRIKLINDRITANPKPIDIAFIGTSHTMNAIDDSEIESYLAEQGINMTVANLAAIFPGRDLHLFLLKKLIQHKKPKLVVIELNEHEQPYGHPVLPYIENYSQLFCCSFYFDFHFIKNFSAFLKRQLVNSYTYHFTDTTNEAPNLQNFLWYPVDRYSPYRFNEYSDTIKTKLTEMLWVATAEYGLDNIKDMVEVAHNNGIEVAFIYLPEYQYWNKPAVVNFSYYSNLAPLLIPSDKPAKNQSLWFDQAHLNINGSKEISSELKSKLVDLLKRNSKS